jgi:hypothetical protein
VGMLRQDAGWHEWDSVQVLCWVSWGGIQCTCCAEWHGLGFSASVVLGAWHGVGFSASAVLSGVECATL